jgi:hypothetical protein
MGARIQIFADDEGEANAWLVVLRSLGLQILGRPSNKITHDGSWMVRARVADTQQQPQSRAS